MLVKIGYLNRTVKSCAAFGERMNEEKDGRK